MMVTPQENAGRALLQALVEYGNRRGLLRPGFLASSIEKETGMLVLAHNKGRFRIEPPGVGATSVIVRALRDMNGRPAQTGQQSLPITWDEAAGAWAPRDPRAPDGLVGEVWRAIAQLAPGAGLTLPPPA